MAEIIKSNVDNFSSSYFGLWVWDGDGRIKADDFK